MPSFDGTGPFGKGPMTGRGQGNCIMTEEQRKRMIAAGENMIPGRGLGGSGRGRLGLGRGFGRGVWGRGVW
jgi:hypothetical protein